ncbi:unnamed protein product [Rotaria sordida]|uniref:Nuclear receptor domain-containing protein n=1 Tax=Rotaria sordida TaxID=392033 RepID=A0A814ITD4_9BILA|nr:unnamed protein product [Rotaria sordida]CAF3588196.1 unnamed protein product [Rotaria sordida]
MNRKRQSTIVLRECKICEAPAQYSYYGVIACSPCKIFFKRNAERGQKVLKCNSDGHCEINSNNRYHCSYCRLMKCFTNGMQTEMLRSSLPKRKKKSEKEKMMTNPVETTSTALVRLNQLEQFPTLNLLRSDQSTLDVDQWNLISNLSHCYDEHSGLSIGQTYMHEQNKLPHKLRYKCASVSELYQMMFNDAQLLYKNNRDFRCLSADDRSILLHSTLSHTVTLSSNFILFKIGLMNYPAYYDAVGIISHPSVISVAQRLASRLDVDIIAMKLFLAILSVSTVNYTVYSNIHPVNLSNIKQILDIQDRYIELAWRYLCYKYNHKETVKYFSNFIRLFITLTEGIVISQDVQWFTDAIDSVVQRTKQAVSIDDQTFSFSDVSPIFV